MDRHPSGNDSDATEKLNADPAHPLKPASESLETLRLDTEPARVSDRKGEETATLISGAAPSPSSGSALEPGHRFGSYHLLQLLGEGGFGQVWEAESLETGRRLALKILTVVPTSSPESVERFKREGRLAASLNHPNCVYVFGAEEIEDYPAITMELMPGGTLQDFISKRGPLPVKQAVDYILDIIDGLEAAQKAGIIHRDVKPSNCFLDAAGKVRIGDFGLSKTLEADTKITVTGTYMGTPAYSSPEQVRGRDVDFRSDMYAVGATLYALLTGKPPFEGKGAAEVLARIVSEEPTPFSEHKVEIPKGLQKIVLRCLAKDRNKRYLTYAALRAALMPFSSEGMATGSLRKRFAAILVDRILLSLPAFVLTLFLFTKGFNLSRVLLQGGPQALLALFYFFLTEKYWGRSLGKLIFGLRVTTTAGAAITFGQAFIRTGIFVFFPRLVGRLMGYLFPGSLIAGPLVEFGGRLVLCSTMRRSNNYRGLHELASGTRVMTVRKKEAIVVPDFQPKEDKSNGRPRQQFGPFRETQVIWETESEALLIATDDLLGRTVWVHRFRDSAQALPFSSLARTRPGRLYWLQGSRKPDDNWDVFEAPSGTSFSHWVQSTGRLSWTEMRQILLGLSIELMARLEEGSAPGRLSLDHIWIDAYGQPKLLDFPVVSGTEDKNNVMEVASDNWKAFLHQIALFGFEGRLVAAEELDAAIPRVPLPEYARPFIARLCGHGEPFESLATIVNELRTLPKEPAKITRAKRAGPLAVTSILPVFSIMFLLLINLLTSDWIKDSMNGERLVSLLKDSEKAGGTGADRIKREAARRILAYSYARAKDSPFGILFIQQHPKDVVEAAESAFRDYPAVTATEASEARELLVKATGDRAFYRKRVFEPEFFVFGPPLFIVFTLSIPALILAFIARGGGLPYLFGIAVQTTDGQRASRLRCLLRALVGWSPLLLIFILNPFDLLEKAISPVGLFALGLELIVVSGAIYSIIKPERGIQDLIVGTHLVPR